MSKPLIEVEDREKDVRLSVSLRPDVAEDLKLYSEYAAGSSQNHIIAASLKRLFKEDKGFRDYKSQGLRAAPESTSKRKSKEVAA